MMYRAYVLFVRMDYRIDVTGNPLIGREKGWTGGCSACSLQVPVTPLEEVRPMNAVPMWVLPRPVTAGRST